MAAPGPRYCRAPSLRSSGKLRGPGRGRDEGGSRPHRRLRDGHTTIRLTRAPTTQRVTAVTQTPRKLLIHVCIQTKSDPELRFLPGSGVKNPCAGARDASPIPGAGRSPGGEHRDPPQCSCLENPTDRGAWWATVHGVAKSQMQLGN